MHSRLFLQKYFPVHWFFLKLVVSNLLLNRAFEFFIIVIIVFFISCFLLGYFPDQIDPLYYVLILSHIFHCFLLLCKFMEVLIVYDKLCPCWKCTIWYILECILHVFISLLYMLCQYLLFTSEFPLEVEREFDTSLFISDSFSSSHTSEPLTQITGYYLTYCSQEYFSRSKF